MTFQMRNEEELSWHNYHNKDEGQKVKEPYIMVTITNGYKLKIAPTYN